MRGNAALAGTGRRCTADVSVAPNPYAPPGTVVADAAEDAAPAPMASRWRRLGAAFIDTALLVAVYIAIAAGALALFGIDLMGTEEEMSMSEALWAPDLLDQALWFVPYLLIQGPLLWLRGQSIGKLLVGTRIVGPDDRKAPFTRILFRRDLPFAIAACWPGVGMIATTLDLLLIFRKDRRCLHDHMAGTRVVLTRY